MYRLLAMTFMILPALALAEDIRFPDDAGVIDVTKAPYNAKGDGKSDCTEAFNQALLDAAAGKGNIIYVPNGTYVIRDTIRWAGRQTRHVLQGQSRDGTVILLPDNCPGFTDPSKPRAMVWTGEFPPQRFRNAVRNITFDTGKQNFGAIGMQFNASNQGQMNTVGIRGQGVIGLDMGYTGDVGPLLVKDLTVNGFDVGIYTSHATAAQTFENITLAGQKYYGFVNDGQAIAIRNLISNNKVPALFNKRGSSMTTLIGAKLTGGDAQTPAIISQAGLYARDVQTAGYQQAIEGSTVPNGGVSAASVLEYTSHKPISLFDSPDKALMLPIEETPDVAWDDPKEWVSVASFKPREVWLDKAGKEMEAPKDRRNPSYDWTDAVQQAIDSGAKTIYFPRNNGTNKPYAIRGTVHLRGNVHRVIGMESTVAADGEPTIVFEDGTAPVVVIERFDWMYTNMMVRTNTRRTLAIKAVTVNVRVGPGGKVFLEDTISIIRVDKGGTLFARQWNSEYTSEPRHLDMWKDQPWYDPNFNQKEHTHKLYALSPGNLNDGGTFWALGLKTEGDGTLLTTTNGGKSEVLGGLVYANKNFYADKKAFIVKDNSSLSLSIGEWTLRNQPFNLLAETRNGEERILKPGMAPGRGGGALIVLANLYPGEAPPKPEAPVMAPLPAGSGKGLTAEFFEGEFAQAKGTDVRGPAVDPKDPQVAALKSWSVRFTGQIEPQSSGLHWFNTDSTDCRLLINDEVVLDAWRNEARYRGVAVRLEAGQKYNLKFEARGDAKQKVGLSWRQPGVDAKADWTTQLHARTAAVPAVSISASADKLAEAGDAVTITARRTGDVSQALRLPIAPAADLQTAGVMRYAARGTAVAGRDYHNIPDEFVFAAGQSEATIELRSINDKQPEPDRTIAIDLAPSMAYDIAGGAVNLTLVDDDLKSSNGSGLSATYFSDLAFQNVAEQRVEKQISFGWDKAVPAKGINTEKGWSVRWEGFLEPRFSETYRLKFRPSVYSALKVWIDDKQVIDYTNAGLDQDKPRLGQPGRGLTAVMLPLQQGKKHAIRVDYVGLNEYGQHMHMLWSSDSQFEEIVPASQLFAK